MLPVQPSAIPVLGARALGVEALPGEVLGEDAGDVTAGESGPSSSELLFVSFLFRRWWCPWARGGGAEGFASWLNNSCNVRGGCAVSPPEPLSLVPEPDLLPLEELLLELDLELSEPFDELEFELLDELELELLDELPELELEPLSLEELLLSERSQRSQRSQREPRRASA